MFAVVCPMSGISIAHPASGTLGALFAFTTARNGASEIAQGSAACAVNAHTSSTHAATFPAPRRRANGPQPSQPKTTPWVDEPREDKP